MGSVSDIMAAKDGKFDFKWGDVKYSIDIMAGSLTASASGAGATSQVTVNFKDPSIVGKQEIKNIPGLPGVGMSVGGDGEGTFSFKTPGTGLSVSAKIKYDISTGRLNNISLNLSGNVPLPIIGSVKGWEWGINVSPFAIQSPGDPGQTAIVMNGTTSLGILGIKVLDEVEWRIDANGRSIVGLLNPLDGGATQKIYDILYNWDNVKNKQIEEQTGSIKDLANLAVAAGPNSDEFSEFIALNPTIFNLDVNTGYGGTNAEEGLGNVTNGSGLVLVGPNYSAAFSAEYVNEDGLDMAAPSVQATGGPRAANGNESPVVDQINDIRLYVSESGDVLSDQSSVGHVLDKRVESRETPYTDPLALDSADDGIRMGVGTVNFDLNANRVAEPVRWTSPSDPLLVLDVDGNGRINNGTELVDLTNADMPLNLLSLDGASQGGNGDKWLTTADTQFSKLRLWTDLNQDGYASPEELQSLSELGIASIDLDPAHIRTGDVGGSTGVKGVVATYDNETTRTLWDVPLALGSETAPATTMTFYAPNINMVSGSGEKALLAISNDGVQIQLQGSGAAQAIGGAGQDTLQGSGGDDWLIGGKGPDQFEAGDGADLMVIDADDTRINGGAGIDTVVIADDRATLLNLAQSQVEVVYGGYGVDLLIGGGADNYFIDGAAGDDIIYGGTNDDVITGGDGKDVLDGGKGDDLMRGGRGTDIIVGNDGNDVMDGGQDNDTINGGGGNDVVKASAGVDVADGGDGVDLIELRGALEDYVFQSTGIGEWTITDKKNHDGSTVVDGQVSDRDGVQQVKNFERFSYRVGKQPYLFDLGMAAPLPASDTFSVMPGSSSYSISVATLISNDLDFQSAVAPRSSASSGEGLYANRRDWVDDVNRRGTFINYGTSNLSVTWVGDALGGSVSLVNGNVVFAPTPGYSGVCEFAYTVSDRDMVPNAAPTVYLPNEPGTTGIMKARVTLVPNDAPTDPNFAEQWYLGAIKASDAWKAGYTGKGVKVLVLDPPGDFAVAKEVADLGGLEFAGRVSEKFVDTVAHSNHATEVAGVIAAGRGNGVGGVGVAYDATINSVSLAPTGSYALFRDIAGDFASMRGYDVVNSSWSYIDPWQTDASGPYFKAASAIASSAIAEAAHSGRKGLGTVLVYSVGNRRDKGWDAGLSLLTANQYTIAVGGINRVSDIGVGNGSNKPFSQRGANILVSAPASNIQTSSIQFQNQNGDVFGSTTSEVHGTSFSAPVVSGVAALMLQANPRLTYRDVQTILALTATKDFGTGMTDGSTWFSNRANEWNGVGMHYNADFGFGMVDAGAAVRMAQNWASARNHDKIVESTMERGEALPDQGNRTLQFTLTEHVAVEQALLSLQLSHDSWSDLVVKLTSPSGTVSTLLDRPGYANGMVYARNEPGKIRLDKELMSTHFRGEDAAGTWTLTIQDAASGGAGVGDITASLSVVGADPDAIKRYVLTDEYAGEWAITPPAERVSELNASAMSKSVRLDLGGGVSHVNGLGITIGAGIDRAVSGLGDDVLIGSFGNETLLGGEGNDSLQGRDGRDLLDGGVGDDTLDGGAGTDLLIAGQGRDVLTGGSESDIFLINIDLQAPACETVVKDFNAGAFTAGGDTLRIRIRGAGHVSEVTQSVALASGNSPAKLTIKAGASTVMLEGVTQQLNGQQLICEIDDPLAQVGGDVAEMPVDLRGSNAGDDVAIDPFTGNYAPSGAVYVEAVGAVRFVPESTRRLMVNTSSIGTFLPGGGFAITDTVVGGGAIEVSYGEGRVIASAPDLISQSYVEITTPAHYEFDGVRWREGSSGSDKLFAGRVKPPVPQIPDWKKWVPSLQDEWAGLVDNLAEPRYFGRGGDDEIIGGIRAEYLSGDEGADTLAGGLGNDTLRGGAGADTYVFNAGDGQDVITSLLLSNDLITVGAPRGLNGKWDLDRTKHPVSEAPLEAGDVLRFNAIGVSTLAVDTFFRSVTRNGFTAETVIHYGGVDQVGFGAIYTPEQLASSADIELFRAQFDSDPDLILKLDGKSVTNQADVIEQIKFGSTNIHTLGGNDIVYALKSNGLTIDAGADNDTVYALEGGNSILGGQGSDRIEIKSMAIGAGIGIDTLEGGSGDDTILAGSGGVIAYGDDVGSIAPGGNDVINGGAGSDLMFGGYGADALRGEGGDDKLYGGADNDVLSGAQGNDHLYGDAGDDVLSGGEGNDVLEGGAGKDYFDTGAGQDVVFLDATSGDDIADNMTGLDAVRINGVSQASFALIDNGAAVKLSWGGGSITYTGYNLDTQIWLDGNNKRTLRDYFLDKGLKPDDSFQFLGKYDLQMPGNTSQIGTLIGDPDGDQLFGGPVGTAKEIPALSGTRYGSPSAGYWYVLGRAGQDSLAGGLSGAMLDGGGGDDSIRASNGVTVVRDSFHGGEDTLVMPEGMVPEALRFYRIANPLEAAGSFDGLMGVASATPMEQLLGNPLLPDSYSIHDFFGIGQRYADGNFTPSLYHHYDTLRIQSIDGKFVVDVVGYFESGARQNQISSMLFTTVFDENGDAKRYDIDALAASKLQDKQYAVNGQNMWEYGLRPNNITSFSSGYVAGTEGRVIVGGEAGTRLDGRVKVMQLGPYYSDAYGYKVLSSAVVTRQQYQAYKNNSRYFDEAYLTQGSPIMAGLLYNQSYWGMGPDGYEKELYEVKSFQVDAIALPDLILGFGGDDTISAGGTYFELHQSSSSWSGNFESYDYLEWPDDLYDMGRSEDVAPGWDQEDQVNGGAGDDTYIFSRGDMRLHIIATDEENAGAEGVDTLDLSWLASSDANFDILSLKAWDQLTAGDGSLTLYIPQEARYYGHEKCGQITIDAGRNGHLQVDKIKFKDGTVDLRGWFEEGGIAADGRAYFFDRNGYPTAQISKQSEDRYWNLVAALPSHAVRQGSPKADIVMVPRAGLAQGSEGGDLYVIDSQNTSFAVVMLDKSDQLTFSPIADVATYRKTISGGFVGGKELGATYLGKTEEQWATSGVIPLFSMGGTAYSYPSAIPAYSVEWGKLIPETDGRRHAYDLSDWRRMDGSFDDVTDALLTWHTEDATGAQVTRQVVLAGALDGSGHDLVSNYFDLAGVGEDIRVDSSRVSLLTQGNDYTNGLRFSNTWPEQINTLYTLAGDDTVDAFAQDEFLDGEYHGYQNVVYGGGGNDSLDGGAGNDSLYGGADNDVLKGGFGDDLLDGGAGVNTLEGGVGSDIYVIHDARDQIIEGPRMQLLSVGQWRLGEQIWVAPSRVASRYGVNLDYLWSNVGVEQLARVKAQFERNNAHGNGVTYTYFTGQERSLRIGIAQGASPSDCNPDANVWDYVGVDMAKNEYIFSAIELQEHILGYRDTFYDGGWQDEIRADLDIDLRDAQYANVENITALGNKALHFIGGQQDNQLTGNGAGSVLEGLDGSDVYYVFGGDKVLEASDHGYDIIYTGVDVEQLAENVEALFSIGSGLILVGNGLDNCIAGDDGDNILDGGRGADFLDGMGGNDTYLVDSQLDELYESAGMGWDVVWASKSYELSQSNNDVEVMRAATDFGVSLKANSLEGQVLVGGRGGDTLNGGGGNGDSLYGGLGDDTYIVNGNSDVIVESAGAGRDTVCIAYDNSGAAASVVAVGVGNLLNIEHLDVAGAGLYTLVGDANGNRLGGNASANTLIGGLGADTLVGGGGNDTYIVGARTPTYTDRPDVDIIVDCGLSDDDTLKLDMAGANIRGGFDQNLILSRYLLAQGDSLKFDVHPGFVEDDVPFSFEGVVVANYFEGRTYQVENVVFSDGVHKKTSDLIAQLGYDFCGTEGGDVMNASNGVGLKIAFAGDGDDSVVGDSGGNELMGGQGSDTLNGGAGSDMLYGGEDVDTYEFGRGSGTDDVYEHDLSGPSIISLVGVNSTDADVVFERVAHALSGSYDYRDSQDLIIRFSGGSADRLTFRDWWSSASTDENRYIKFDDNQLLNLAQIEGRLAEKAFTSGDDVYYAGGSADILSGFAGRDEIHGGRGDDALHGNDGNDWLFGDDGSDQLWGDSGNDVLNGGAGADRLDGGTGWNTFFVDQAADTVIGGGMIYSSAEAYTLTDTITANSVLYLMEGADRRAMGNAFGNTLVGNGQSNLLQGADGSDHISTGVGGADVLQGGEGDDTLSGEDSFDNAVLDGGGGHDRLVGSCTNNLFVGGKGNDSIFAGFFQASTEDENGQTTAEIFGASGSDILLFNKGDGLDTVYAGDGAKLTLSLGGVVGYEHIKLTQAGSDLLLMVGEADGIIFHDWYGAESHRSVLNVQVIAEAMAAFDSHGTDTLRDDRVEQFSFQGIVDAFDAQSNKNGWSISEAVLLNNRGTVGSSDSAAFGGGLAYQYGKAGSLRGASLSNAQEVLVSSDFGRAAQAFSTPVNGAVLLGF